MSPTRVVGMESPFTSSVAPATKLLTVRRDFRIGGAALRDIGCNVLEDGRRIEKVERAALAPATSWIAVLDAHFVRTGTL